MINNYSHTANVSLLIRRSDLRHRYVVNRYDIMVEGDKNSLQGLHDWLILQLSNAGYTQDGSHHTKNLNSIHYTVTVDPVLHTYYNLPVDPAILRLSSYAW
jgi:hypothetical protein